MDCPCLLFGGQRGRDHAAYTRAFLSHVRDPISASGAAQVEAGVTNGSKEPVEEIGKALRKHVDRSTLRKVIEDLQDVPGSASGFVHYCWGMELPCMKACISSNVRPPSLFKSIALKIRS